MLFALQQNADAHNITSTISWKTLNGELENYNSPYIDYNTFSQLYDDERNGLQRIVADFDKNGITLNTKISAESPNPELDTQEPSSISQIAKQAVRRKS